jgi:hypothetical protein
MPEGATLNVGDTLYMVRNWVDPENGQPFNDWITRKHIPDVVALIGVEWAQRVALAQTDDRGWTSHLLIYKFESSKALDAYMTSDARTGFWEELKQFADVHTGERLYGEIDFSYG